MTLQQLSVTKTAIPSMIRTVLKPDGKNTSMNNTQWSPQNQSQFHPSYKDNEEGLIILRSEDRQAIRISPKNKSPGKDGITTEAILASGEIGITWLTSIFQRAWIERKVPDYWQRTVIVPIWKKKSSKRDCGMYRGISPLSHMGKLYGKVLEQRVRYKVEPFLSKVQSRTIPKQGTK